MEISCCLCLEGTRIIIDEEAVTNPDEQYNCCQGAVHIKVPECPPQQPPLQRACFYTGVSAIVLCIFSAVCMAFGVYSVNLWLDIVLIILNFMVAVIMLVGLYYEKAPLMVPFIVSEISQCVGFFFLASYVLYYTIVIKKQRVYQKFDQILMVVSIYLGIIVCGAAVWVAAKCYHYLRGREDIVQCPEDRCMWA